MKAAIIGCGTIFPMHAASIKSLDDVELVSVCDIKEDRVKSKATKYNCKSYLNYKEMLDKEALDAVHICTPHYLHKPMVEYAAKKKINVLVEKPMALNPKDAESEIKIAKKNNIKLGVVLQSRFNPSSKLIRETLDSGKLGKIISARIMLAYHKPDEYYKKSDWKGIQEKEGGGVVIDQSIHPLDVLSWFCGYDIEFVEATTANRMHDYIEVEDVAEGVIQFKNGPLVCFYLINYYGYDSYVEMELYCEKAKVRIVKNSATIEFSDGTKAEAAPKPNECIDYGDGVKDYWGVCHCKLIEDFYQAIKEDREPKVNGVEGKKAQRLVWAIYESAKRKKRIHFKN